MSCSQDYVAGDGDRDGADPSPEMNKWMTDIQCSNQGNHPQP